jgi:hypothetical protein
MGLKLIHGFLHDKQKAKPEWGNITISETVLIEMDSPSDRIISLIGLLPAYPASPSGANPKGLSFTFDLSPHPDNNALVLRTASDLTQIPDSATFWTIELSYSVFSISELTSGLAGFANSNPNPRHRKDQRDYIDPEDRPVVWNMSTSIVRKETYMHENGLAPIVHANGLPLTEPYSYEETHETHTFSYNIPYSVYDHDNFSPHVGKVSSAPVLGFAADEVKFVSFTANEEYESNGNGLEKTEYHYVRVTLSFEYNPSGWSEDAKLVSMSTVQLVAGELIAINTSPTEYAQEPWPLLADGTAAQYDDLDPTLFAIVDHGYPRTINLSAVVDANVGQGKKELTIP